ncbi:MAG: tol-pal system-associated acyl-CoA thioesterase [Zoogloeaceae bacterium]|jgi:acyl-CoA thioester hydrolase|nr:tol-pal system-associated acyl-CoA thioesterase [Zoogloeaceae bacterium]
MNQLFSLPARVYYEDTDAGGVIYYASYLKFFERCRTEWLRAIGGDQAKLLAEDRLCFVVRNVNIDYLRPGRLDDLLDVTLSVEKKGGTHIVFRQEAKRGEETLVTAQVRIVCVDIDKMKPAPLPALFDRFAEAT